ncbi:TraB/GumN family protein [Undibacterium sp. CY18W]|uniref:TraB/GumN family protein n=1 Tax=Undibacterium hunanense TaxID=2762292 RepID=A0ABR6ZX14_9BURK|nr:TraB/GumN family protein [Undibacterium hunanense]MBC3920397.1 TraB/GumN family protein [Undibacterium hunanense]
MKKLKEIMKLLNITARFFAALTIFCFVLAHAQANDNTPLYRVKKSEKTMYLLASAHMLSQDDYPLSKKLPEALKSSDVLVVEAKGSFLSQENFPIVEELLKLPLGKGAADYVGKQEFEYALSLVNPQFFKYKDSLLDVVKKSHPYLLTILIENSTPSPLEFIPAIGIDRYMLDLAAKKGMRIEELEGVKHNSMSYLKMLSENEVKSMLTGVVKLNQSQELRVRLGTNAKQMLQAYREGDLKKLSDLEFNACSNILNYPLTYCKTIFTARNNFMTQKIEEYFQKTETYLVVLGCSHFVGNDGVLDGLRKKGYQIDIFQQNK